ncbi:hypothetical protein KZ779_30685 [Escherichia coli]|nr:hypothetical protein [Escherichia coli]
MSGKAEEEEETERGTGTEKIRKTRAVYGRLPPAAPVCSAPVKTATRAVRHPW